MRKLTTEIFKKRSFIIHDGKYSYEKTDLTKLDENGKVIITCPIHGDFKQQPYNHLRGSGCPKCANNIKKTQEEVIEEIKKVHGNKYIIPDDFVYLSNKKPMHIICPIHGDFYPTYRNFVANGKGCLKCFHHIYTNDEFISDVREKYGTTFDYDKIEFRGYRNKVLIKCSKCGKTHEVSPKRLLDGRFKCDCEFSIYTILEEIVANKLDELNIEYEFQFKRDWLKYKGNLSIDFFLPKYKVGIECQGRFHFEPYKKGDKVSILNFEKQFERDKIKHKLCEENNIKLLYFSDKNDTEYFEPIYNNINDLIKEIKKNN